MRKSILKVENFCECIKHFNKLRFEPYINPLHKTLLPRLEEIKHAFKIKK